MYEPFTDQLERSPTASSLAPQAARMDSAPDCRGAWRQRRGHQSVGEPCPRQGSRCAPAPPSAWCCTLLDTPAAGPLARTMAPPFPAVNSSKSSWRMAPRNGFPWNASRPYAPELNPDEGFGAQLNFCTAPARACLHYKGSIAKWLKSSLKKRRRALAAVRSV